MVSQIAWFSSVQSLSHVWLFATPWTTALQASLSITNSQSLLKLMSIKSVMPFNPLILCHPLSPPAFSLSQHQGFFPMSQFFASGGQNTEASAPASVLPMNIQDWFPLGVTSWISLQSKGLSRVFSNITVGDKFIFSNTNVGYKFIKICKPLLNWPGGWGEDRVKYQLTNL